MTARKATPWQRSEFDRLLWVERAMIRLAAELRADAASTVKAEPGVEAAADLAAGLEESAKRIEDVLSASHAPGGPPVDRFAEIDAHLAALKDQLATTADRTTMDRPNTPPGQVQQAITDARDRYGPAGQQ